MPKNFYEKELKRIRVHFNQTIGMTPLCNPRVRIMAIFGIVRMGLLERKIKKEKDEGCVRKFLETKEKLNQIFLTLIKEKGSSV